MTANATSGRSPLKFFLLVLILALPLWLLGPLVGNIASLKIPVTDLALAFVPLIAAVILVHKEEGYAGVLRLFMRVLDFKMIKRPVWYLPLVLLAPLIYVLLLTVMRLIGDEAVAGNHLRMAPVLFVLFFVLAAGEETGWMGYAIDPMQDRWGALVASIVLAIPWWLGHFPSIIHIGGTRADLAWWLPGAVAIRILIVWIYNNTGRSLFAAVLFHALINIGRLVSYPAVGSHYSSAYQHVGYSLFAVAALIVTCLYDSETLTRPRHIRHMSH